MIKKLFMILLSALLLLCLGACGEKEQGNETQVQAVFDTENIVRITFYAYGGSGTGSDVPSEEMEEYIAWLGSFHAGKMIPDQLPPSRHQHSSSGNCVRRGNRCQARTGYHRNP